MAVQLAAVLDWYDGWSAHTSRAANSRRPVPAWANGAASNPAGEKIGEHAP